MRSSSPEPKGKLDAMTGYSFTTPVWDGGAWVTPAVAEVRVAPAAAEVKAARHANGPEDAVPGWERRGGRPDRPGQDGRGGAGAPHHPVLAAPRGPAGVCPEGG